ncbi:2-amino-4-hydroxy-6-hydroxymethyldihydropteridine diphosphokinase [Sphingobacterium sp. T2]|uniref:2-amino-4-hydroxy-6- hydroxymethyldihydropteridine diphosphokinase n=1 Tax=Sphingobacterium sp. T2 TaxID=1590596 RepID=UPI00057B8284|nr:2-amino-4-hydroxy-6-hydroxymethyldihydropteridine diphosphokinase [Sphingobacterium sp. T2]
MNVVYILLGANLGNPLQQIGSALRLLQERLGALVAVSSLYQSEAWGVEEQPIFYNQVVSFSTPLSAQECLAICQSIENELGRIRHERWGARVIDVDILYYNEEIIEKSDLVVPHPYIAQRRFTLIPLCEIAPDYVHPVFKVSNKDLLLSCEDQLGVIKL